jgi:hypothetical protein
MMFVGISSVLNAAVVATIALRLVFRPQTADAIRMGRFMHTGEAKS